MRVKDKFYEMLADMIPRKILACCIIRSWSIATTEAYTNKTPYEVDWEMVYSYLRDGVCADTMPPQGYVKIFQDKKGEWRFNILGLNYNVIAVSEGYATKRNAKDGLSRVVNACRYLKLYSPKK